MQGSSSSPCVNNPSSSSSLAPPAPVVVLGAADVPPPPRRVVAAHRLPLRASPDPASPFGFAFSLDPDALPLQLSRGLPAPVTYVGTLPPAAAGEIVPSDDLDDYLLQNYSCLPVHLAGDLHRDFYDGFCKRYLWPLLHYLRPPFTPADAGNLRFDGGEYAAFLAANRRFADRVIQVVSPDDGDLVVVHDYHLCFLPAILRRKCPRAGVGLFLHSPFPSADTFLSVPVRFELLRGLLNADLLGFHTSDYARNFASSCSRHLAAGINATTSSGSGGGIISMNYHGRAVQVRVFSVGVDMGRVRAALGSPEAAAKAREIADAYRGRVLMVGVDDLDHLKGVTLKLLAMERMLEADADMRRRVVLVQINNPARSRGAGADAVRREAERIKDRINRLAAAPVVVMVDGPVPMPVKAAYYAAADCCVVAAVRDGLNRIPYFYTACREESSSPVSGGAGAVVVSEFAGCAATLGGAIRVNPCDAEALAAAMRAAVTMGAEERAARHRENYGYLRAHDAAAWARAFDAALEVACRDLPAMRFVGAGFGMTYRAMAYRPAFQMLAAAHVRPAYRAAARRLVLLDYDGTLVAEVSDERERAPGDLVIRLVNELCGDPKNAVFIVSGRRREQLAAWFAPCEKLGICAEHGYFTRWSRDDPWQVMSDKAAPLVRGATSGWEAVAEHAMRHYTEATPGSYMEVKETAMAWHYQNADPVVGPCQARELHSHLASALAGEPASIAIGTHVVEVNPKGVNKGVAVEALLAAMARRGKSPDCVVCVGNGGEAMFAALERASKAGGALAAGASVFACTVGKKAGSAAAFYVEEPADVVGLLAALARCGGSPAVQAE
ncbi:unnamed protein product [Urochloa decumbens]|uniref:Trehalose-phosphatase n=1 Tax=Urochloa decumbens TaxID=240449 RepID=A0ABC9CQI5_9POAL